MTFPRVPNSFLKFHPLPLTDLDLDLSPVIVDGDGLDCPGAIGGGAVRAEVVLVRPRDPLRLEPSPTGGVVRDGTVLNALEQDVTLVICTGTGLCSICLQCQASKSLSVNLL